MSKLTDVVLCYTFNSLFGLFHVALDIKACHLRSTVCSHCYGLLEMTGELAFSVVGDVDLTLFTRFDGCLCVRGDRAAARSDSLVDYKRSRSHVGEGEGRLLYGRILRELAEVVAHLVELNLSLSLLRSYRHCDEE